jgi:hypothetical protein
VAAPGALASLKPVTHPSRSISRPRARHRASTVHASRHEDGPSILAAVQDCCICSLPGGSCVDLTTLDVTQFGSYRCCCDLLTYHQHYDFCCMPHVRQSDSCASRIRTDWAKQVPCCVAVSSRRWLGALRNSPVDSHTRRHPRSILRSHPFRRSRRPLYRRVRSHPPSSSPRPAERPRRLVRSSHS